MAQDTDEDIRTTISKLLDAGLSVRAIAHATGVSTQRIYQLLAAMQLAAPTKR